MEYKGYEIERFCQGGRNGMWLRIIKDKITVFEEFQEGKDLHEIDNPDFLDSKIELIKKMV